MSTFSCKTLIIQIINYVNIHELTLSQLKNEISAKVDPDIYLPDTHLKIIFISMIHTNKRQGKVFQQSKKL